MIETCSRRCMLLGTVCLGILTIAVLIIESHLADSLPGHKYRNRTLPTENDSTCWKDQEYTILTECHPCTGPTLAWFHYIANHEYPASLKIVARRQIAKSDIRIDFEIKSKSIGVCVHTHYKEVLRCKNGEHVTRSCDKVAHLEERAFWKFVLWTLFLSVTSCFAVMCRLQVLNRKAIRRAHQHLANGLS